MKRNLAKMLNILLKNDVLVQIRTAVRGKISELEAKELKLEKLLDSKNPKTGILVLDEEKSDLVMKKLGNIQMEKFIVRTFFVFSIRLYIKKRINPQCDQI